LSLAKSLGAFVITVEELFDWLSVSETKAQQALGELSKPAGQVKKQERAEIAWSMLPSWDTIQGENEPYKAIIATAADRGCDLIVMASHGRSGLSAIVLGSVKNKVLTHTKVPLSLTSTTIQSRRR
jgi:nucleotide-binding universal stress UspA family protein